LVVTERDKRMLRGAPARRRYERAATVPGRPKSSWRLQTRRAQAGQRARMPWWA